MIRLLLLFTLLNVACTPSYKSVYKGIISSTTCAKLTKEDAVTKAIKLTAKELHRRLKFAKVDTLKNFFKNDVYIYVVNSSLFPDCVLYWNDSGDEFLYNKLEYLTIGGNSIYNINYYFSTFTLPSRIISCSKLDMDEPKEYYQDLKPDSSFCSERPNKHMIDIGSNPDFYLIKIKHGDAKDKSNKLSVEVLRWSKW